MGQRIELGSPALQAGFLPFDPPGKLPFHFFFLQITRENQWKKIEGKEIKEDTPGKQYFKGSWDDYSHDKQKSTFR